MTEVPRLARFPPGTEERHRPERDQAAHDVDELGTDEIAPRELDDGKRAAADQHRGPYAAKPAPTAHRDDQPGGHEEGHERQLAAGHRAERLVRDAGDGGERENR